jgi:hypothetical protein
MSGFVPRFAVEVAFLVLLALAAGLAELGTPWIVLVMVVGWLLVALVEWLAWRSETDVEPSAAASPEPATQEPPSWDIDEILAPLPGPQDSTTVPPRDERP